MNEITVAEADRRRPTSQIVDVRENEEVATGMIPGALHVPMGQLGQRLSELSPTQSIIVVCRSGRRSAAGPAAGSPSAPRSRRRPAGRPPTAPAGRPDR